MLPSLATCTKLCAQRRPRPRPRHTRVHMPSPAHAVLVGEVAYRVLHQVRASAQGIPQPLAAAVSRIHNLGQSSILLPYGGSKRSVLRHPDISFGDVKARYPRVIIEVAYSQKRKQLAELANSYITGSRGGVGVVVGIDLPYRRRGESQLMIWRSKSATENSGEGAESEMTVSQV